MSPFLKTVTLTLYHKNTTLNKQTHYLTIKNYQQFTPDQHIIYAFILDWGLYESDKQIAFKSIKTPEEWEKYKEEIEFLETIFTDAEKTEIFDEFANVY